MEYFVLTIELEGGHKIVVIVLTSKEHVHVHVFTTKQYSSCHHECVHHKSMQYYWINYETVVISHGEHYSLCSPLNHKYTY